MSFVPLGTSCFRWRDFRQQQKIPRFLSIINKKTTSMYENPCKICLFIDDAYKRAFPFLYLHGGYSEFNSFPVAKRCPLAMQRRKWLWSAGYPSQQHLPVMELLENQLNLWTLTYLDIFGALTVEDFLHITTSLQYTQFCKCFLPELQSISCPRFFASSHWFSKHLRSTFLGSKEHSGVSMCEPHISCLRLPWDAKFYLDSCWILSKRDCQAATFHNCTTL